MNSLVVSLTVFLMSFTAGANVLQDISSINEDIRLIKSQNVKMTSTLFLQLFELQGEKLKLINEAYLKAELSGDKRNRKLVKKLKSIRNSTIRQIQKLERSKYLKRISPIKLRSIYYYLALYYDYLNKKKKYEFYLRQVLRYARSKADINKANQLLAEHYTQSNQFKKAKGIYKKFEGELRTWGARDLLNYAWVEARLSRTSKALSLAKEAVEYSFERNSLRQLSTAQLREITYFYIVNFEYEDGKDYLRGLKFTKSRDFLSYYKSILKYKYDRRAREFFLSVRAELKKKSIIFDFYDLVLEHAVESRENKLMYLALDQISQDLKKLRLKKSERKRVHVIVQNMLAHFQKKNVSLIKNLEIKKVFIRNSEKALKILTWLKPEEKYKNSYLQAEIHSLAKNYSKALSLYDSALILSIKAKKKHYIEKNYDSIFYLLTKKLKKKGSLNKYYFSYLKNGTQVVKKKKISFKLLAIYRTEKNFSKVRRILELQKRNKFFNQKSEDYITWFRKKYSNDKNLPQLQKLISFEKKLRLSIVETRHAIEVVRVYQALNSTGKDRRTKLLSLLKTRNVKLKRRILDDLLVQKSISATDRSLFLGVYIDLKGIFKESVRRKIVEINILRFCEELYHKKCQSFLTKIGSNIHTFSASSRNFLGEYSYLFLKSYYQRNKTAFPQVNSIRKLYSVKKESSFCDVYTADFCRPKKDAQYLEARSFTTKLDLNFEGNLDLGKYQKDFGILLASIEKKQLALKADLKRVRAELSMQYLVEYKKAFESLAKSLRKLKLSSKEVGLLKAIDKEIRKVVTALNGEVRNISHLMTQLKRKLLKNDLLQRYIELNPRINVNKFRISLGMIKEVSSES